MKRVLCLWMAAFAGCSSLSRVYVYRVLNDGCNCEFYRLTNEKAHVAYSFSGTYSVNGAIVTRLTVSIRNDNKDTLDLSLAYVKVSSRNVPYQYNGKFLPVTIANVPPGEERTLSLRGQAEGIKGDNPWLAIAGEELSLTLKGMRVKGRQLATEVIRFVPHNPKL